MVEAKKATTASASVSWGSATTTTTTTTTKVNKPPQKESSSTNTGTSRHRTRTHLTGYGSRAVQKSIFFHPSKGVASPIKLPRKQRNRPLNHNSTTTLWVQRVVGGGDGGNHQSQGGGGGGEETSQLWFRYYDPNRQTHFDNNKNNSSSSTTLCFSILSLHNNHEQGAVDNNQNLDDVSGDSSLLSSSSSSSSLSNNWHIQTCADHELPSLWVPVEGIYGVYLLPSGLLWLLITESETVYQVPPQLLPSSNNTTKSSIDITSSHRSSSDADGDHSSGGGSCCWKIQRVKSMELFHQAASMSFGVSSHSQQQQHKEEARQLHLLRQALKEHDFFFVPHHPSETLSQPSSRHSSMIVPDMTRNLQESFDIYQRQRQKVSHNETNGNGMTAQRSKNWWNRDNTDDDDDIEIYPDSRFFWNEMAVYPLLQAYRHTLAEKGGSISNINDTTTTTATTPNTPTKALMHYSNNHTSDTSLCLQVLLDHVIPVTSAFCGVQRHLRVTPTSDWWYDELLISRRSRYRAGTRFTKRGADAVGHVANYAETEQICVVYPNHPAAEEEAVTDSLELYSHVQTRGSIPLRWSSPTDITTYRPRVRIGTDPLAQARAVWAHVVEQIQRYTSPSDSTRSATSTSSTTTTRLPQLVFCNLIDKKSDQGRLGRAFEAVLQAVLETYQDFKTHLTATTNRDTDKKEAKQKHSITLKNPNLPSDISSEGSLLTSIPFLTPQTVQHIWFDFHANVKGGKWNKLGTLLQELSPTVIQHGFFSARLLDGQQWTVTQRQSGVIRTNCMDCLDRTNVVQSIIGRYMLFRQLSTRRGTLSATSNRTKQHIHHRRSFPLEYNAAFRRDPMTLTWEAGEVAHRMLWADNADAISRLYAGTAALKGDFTRTGKRTKRGALDDGMNSLQRYYLNNFLDADRQEGIDLMVGQAQFTPRHEMVEVSADEKLSADSRQTTTTLKEAVRAMMLSGKSVDDGASDDRFHIRIKQPQTTSALPKKRKGERQSITFMERRRRPLLELRWLPGDLQNQMRSRANSWHDSSLPIRHGFIPDAAARLQAMDRRLTTAIPWWVGADSESDEDNERDVATIVDEGATINAGHLVGALMAAYQAPLATATLTVAMLGLLLEQRRSKSRKLDD